MNAYRVHVKETTLNGMLMSGTGGMNKSGAEYKVVVAVMEEELVQVLASLLLPNVKSVGGNSIPRLASAGNC
jgi:hypothetical protein